MTTWYSPGNTKPALRLPILTTMEGPNIHSRASPPFTITTRARKTGVSAPLRSPKLHHQPRNYLFCPGNRHSHIPHDLSAGVGKDLGAVDNPRSLCEGLSGVYGGLDCGAC